MKQTIIILVSLLLLISCESEFSDFIEKEPGVYMKLLSFENDKSLIELKNYGAVNIEIYAKGRLLYTHSKHDRINLKDNEFNFLIKHLTVGDSCQFLVSTKRIQDLFSPLKIEEVSIDELAVFIKLENVYEDELDSEMVEQLVLNSYLTKSGAKEQGGIYMEEIEQGNGKKIESGDEITIAYKGYFINGLKFDEISGKTSFTFAYGSQGQVIKGLEIAINSMIEGEKSKIIIPSQLAFGEVGSTTLIVPPFTTVVYDLEIVKVN